VNAFTYGKHADLRFKFIIIFKILYVNAKLIVRFNSRIEAIVTLFLKWCSSWHFAYQRHALVCIKR